MASSVYQPKQHRFGGYLYRLPGFAQVIKGLYSQTEVRFNFASYIKCATPGSILFTNLPVTGRKVKAFMRDLKKIHQTSTKELAERNLDKLEASSG